MGVYIKSMEMPTNCWLCPLSVLLEKPREILFCRIIKEEVLRNKVDGNCPLIEVPPHGRLIDAEALLESIKEAKKKQPEISDVYDEDYFAVAEWVAYAPTVIESEEE